MAVGWKWFNYSFIWSPSNLYSVGQCGCFEFSNVSSSMRKRFEGVGAALEGGVGGKAGHWISEFDLLGDSNGVQKEASVNLERVEACESRRGQKLIVIC